VRVFWAEWLLEKTIPTALLISFFLFDIRPREDESQFRTLSWHVYLISYSALNRGLMPGGWDSTELFTLTDQPNLHPFQSLH
jgi:hypothetical protein